MRAGLAGARELLRACGWSGLLVRAVDRTLAPLGGSLRAYHLVAQPVPAAPLAKEGGRRLEVRRVAAGDPALERMQRPAAEIARRFAGGGVGFVAERDGELCGFLWLVHERYADAEDRSVFRVVPGEPIVWDLDVYVEPQHRLGRTFVRLWDAANDYLRARGVRWTLSRISLLNRASLGAHERLGMRRIARLAYLGLGPLQLYAGGLPPYLHVDWRGSGPELRLRAPGPSRLP